MGGGLESHCVGRVCLYKNWQVHEACQLSFAEQHITFDVCVTVHADTII